MPNGFRGWLSHQQKRDDTVGDIARDVALDHCMPYTITRTMLFSHLRDHGASDACIVAAHRAWHEWMEANPTFIPSPASAPSPVSTKEER
jgi:hypothetical protein